MLRYHDAGVANALTNGWATRCRARPTAIAGIAMAAAQPPRRFSSRSAFARFVAARGRLRTDTVVVDDEREANTLYNKGAFGIPQSGGSITLDLTESLYLMENNRLRVDGQDVASLLRYASTREDDFEIRYIVYRDLRGRTFTVKHSNVTDYNVYPRGALPGRTPSSHLVRCLSERGQLDPTVIVEEVERATRVGKKLLIALVDEEGDLTYYEASTIDLQGEAKIVPAKTAKAHLLADRVMVLDPADAKMLFDDGWFGRDVGLGLQLSLPEAVYLAGAGRLDVWDAMGEAQFDARGLAERARAFEPDFDLRDALYRDLRARGVVVKTGFKYGTHFRAYHGAPDEEHAPYLIHAVADGRTLPWAEVAGFVRLAHGVRKRLFFAAPRGGSFALLELARRRP